VFFCIFYVAGTARDKKETKIEPFDGTIINRIALLGTIIGQITLVKELRIQRKECPMLAKH